jgi:hypothetical protein
MNNTPKLISYGPGHYALEHHQPPPDEGDTPYVLARIFLPTDREDDREDEPNKPEKHWLTARLRFGHRLQIAGEPLSCSWGSIADVPYDSWCGAIHHMRSAHARFDGATYAEMEAAGTRWARTELDRLSAALAARAAAEACAQAETAPLGDYEVIRLGQCDVEVSDDVIVAARIWLPGSRETDDRPLLLAPQYRYGWRCCVAGHPLVCDWGTMQDADRCAVGREKQFRGPSYASLEASAHAWAGDDLAKLREQIRRRQMALIAADLPARATDHTGGQDNATL